MIFLQLFYTFLVIGAFTFGGGYSMIALIQHQVVEVHAWLTTAEFADLLAISQITPGPVGINTATYAGYTAVLNAGYPQWTAVCGSLLASGAVVLLPVALVLVVSRWLLRSNGNKHVSTIMAAVRLAVVGMIAAAALGLMSTETFGVPAPSRHFITSVVIFVAVLVLSLWRKASPILLMLASAVVGLIVYGI